MAQSTKAEERSSEAAEPMAMGVEPHPLAAIKKLTDWAETMKAAQPATEAFDILQRILDRLMESHQVLQESGARKLQDTNVKIQEVTSATESAAMDIMDGVGRALELVDQMETEGSETAAGGQLREELFDIMNLLQFQDVTTQQLQYTSSVLNDLEADLIAFVEQLCEMELSPVSGGVGMVGDVTFNPLASMRDADVRQAAADALLTGKGSSTAA